MFIYLIVWHDYVAMQKKWEDYQWGSSVCITIDAQKWGDRLRSEINFSGRLYDDGYIIIYLDKKLDYKFYYINLYSDQLSCGLQTFIQTW